MSRYHRDLGEKKSSGIRSRVLLVVTNLVSIGCLVWALRDAKLGELKDDLASMNWWWVAVAVIADVVMYFWHAMRWRILLRPVVRLRYWDTVRAIYVGLFANEVLPFRVGEVLRCYLLTKETRLLAKRDGAALFGFAHQRLDRTRVRRHLALRMPVCDAPLHSHSTRASLPGGRGLRAHDCGPGAGRGAGGGDVPPLQERPDSIDQDPGGGNCGSCARIWKSSGTRAILLPRFCKACLISCWE